MMQDAAQDIRDNLDPIAIGDSIGIPWLKILLAALTAALIVHLALRIARRDVKRKPPPSPEAAAYRRLNALAIANTRQFYFELSTILVEYFDAQFPIGIPFCTSEEILERLRSIEMMTRECEIELRAFFDVCDRAKFGPEFDDADPADPDDARDAAALCRRILDGFASQIANVRRLGPVPPAKAS
jgi:hypothetical protein